MGGIRMGGSYLSLIVIFPSMEILLNNWKSLQIFPSVEIFVRILDIVCKGSYIIS